jgi:atypical dual specificity phosphatase
LDQWPKLLSVNVYLTIICVEKHPQLAEIMAETHRYSYKALIRLADSYLSSHPKLAALAYAQAAFLNPALNVYVQWQLGKLVATVQWGPMLTEDELSSLSSQLRPSLLKPWPVAASKSIAPMTLCLAPVESRKRLLFRGEHVLPRFFSWLLPQRLAASSTPRHEADIDIFAQMGIATVLTLTSEEPLDPQWFAFRATIRNVFIPVANWKAPSIAEMDLIYERFCADGHGVWLVHCGGGKGRAGTVLACVLAMHGMNGDAGAAAALSGKDGGDVTEAAAPKMNKTEAIALVRSVRPGSIESTEQEDFVGAWISHRWRLAHQLRDRGSQKLEEPPPGPLEIELDPATFPSGSFSADALRVAFLVGLPGSGKSWLASAISKRRRPGLATARNPRARSTSVVVISQDECRSRSACENTLGSVTAHMADGDDILVLLDRCNPDAGDRRAWLRLVAPLSRHKPIAIFFDYPRGVCERRIDRRLGHPTIRPGGGAHALDHMASRLEPPCLEEGFGAVLTVRSCAAAWEAVLLLGGSNVDRITKFPRTPHLLDLGAATADDVVLSSKRSSFSAFPFSASKAAAAVIEEKIDGANMGFSLSPVGYDPSSSSHHGHSASYSSYNAIASPYVGDSELQPRDILVQNRSHRIDPFDAHHLLHPQFRPLAAWLRRHAPALRRILGRDAQFPDRFVLFGEWVVARHSIGYTRLPDRFVAFDLLDRATGLWASRKMLTRALDGSGIAQVPLIEEHDPLFRHPLDPDGCSGTHVVVRLGGDDREEADKASRAKKGVSAAGPAVQDEAELKNVGEARDKDGKLKGEETEVGAATKVESVLSPRYLERLATTTQSKYYDGLVEGVYVRFEDEARTQTVARAKVVRGDFIAGNSHWNKGPLKLNGIVAPGDEWSP